MKVKIAASLMCADLTRLGDEVEKLERGGIDLFHFDIMDGHFVPNLMLGPLILQSLRDKTSLPFDAHLQITNPEKYIHRFAKVGSNIISIHVEVCHSLHRVIETIKKNGMRACVALNPATPLSWVECVLPEVDMVLLMTVDPGYAGQAFIPAVVPKIKRLREMIEEKKLNIDVEVDGNINERTIPQVLSAGANVLVAGTSSIFRGKEDLEKATRSFRKICGLDPEK
ncbi:MAG: ribulose-phosphate 3-epimerase [bacterium]